MGKPLARPPAAHPSHQLHLALVAPLVRARMPHEPAVHHPVHVFAHNTGAVHQYVASPGGRTAYLCELRSGREVVVVTPEGRTRRGLVGRSKLETRPLVGRVWGTALISSSK